MKWHPFRRGARNINEAGLEFIARLEGCVLRPYNDSAGHCTVGVGHLLHYGPCTAQETYQRITQPKAMELLRKDADVAVKAVRQGVKRRLNQHQFNALVSFTFNVGAQGFLDSTLLRRVNERASAHDIREAFLMWTKAGGLVSQGLINRREAEADLFNSKEHR